MKHYVICFLKTTGLVFPFERVVPIEEFSTNAASLPFLDIVSGLII